MGTATVKAESEQSLLWGPTCLRFLDRLYRHPSKASQGYYYKNHCQYFAALHDSLGEISRVLKRRGSCALVVQNSHYKELLNDLPKVCIEMAESHGMALESAWGFEVTQSISRLNANARKYALPSRREYEEVVVLSKT